MQLIDSSDIDRELWDTMVWNDPSSLFYNLSWCLDTLCENWIGVVKGDYQSAIAFPMQRKLSVRYTFNPFLFHRASVVGALTSDELDDAVWKAAKYVDLRLREKLEGATIWNNFELPLSKSYLDLAQGYSQNTRRNLKKSVKHDLVFRRADNAALISFVFKENVSFSKLGIKEKEYENFEKLMLEAFDCEIGRGYIVEQDEEPVAVGFFIEFNNRVTFVKGTSTADGREIGAMPFLFDRVINEFHSSKLVLDFAGSNVDSVGRFYSGFGAENVPVYYLKRNSLPFPLNQLKS